MNYLRDLTKNTIIWLNFFYNSYFFLKFKKKNKSLNSFIPGVEKVSYFNRNSFILKFLLLIKDIDLIFTFKFQKVDKKIRKYSRGKIGKYKCDFKYLPAYKRLNFIFLTLKKDFIFFKKTFFKSNFNQLLFNFMFKKQSLIYNIKRYSNFFFYNNVSIFRI